MTNGERFRQVFGFFPNEYTDCPLPLEMCEGKMCHKCAFQKWWEKEFKPCFEYVPDSKKWRERKGREFVMEYVSFIMNLYMEIVKESQDLNMDTDDFTRSVCVDVLKYAFMEEKYDESV